MSGGSGRIFDIQRFSVHDGPGIRTTVFLKGCPLDCWWCHNPESRDREPFVHYRADRCLGCGACIEACHEDALVRTADGVVADPARCPALCREDPPCAAACPAEARRVVGRPIMVEALVAEVEKDRLYYDTSGGGVTFSGGEPLLQWPFLLEALEACGARDLHRVVDTTGYGATGVLLRVAERTDLFLFDLKVMDEAVHRRVTGVPLAPILENLEALLGAGARVRIRIPTIPGITTDATVAATADYLASIPPVDGVDLLPFHASARDKHRTFGLPWRMETDAPIPEERMAGWRRRLTGPGVRAAVGG